MSILKVGEDVAEEAVGGATSIFGGWQAYLIGGMMLLAVGGFGGWRVTSWADSHKVDTLTASVATEAANTQDAWNAYDALDKSLKNMKADSDKRVAAAMSALAAEKAAHGASDARVKALLNSHMKPGDDIATATDALILQSLGDGQ